MSEQSSPEPDLDEAVSRAGAGLAQKLPIALSVLADQARRGEDAAAAAAAAARAQQRQDATLSLQEAQTGYLHASVPGWAEQAGKDDLANAWVAAAPWRGRDPAAAHVADTIEQRFAREWPDLAAAYDGARQQGMAPLEAMGRAVDQRLTGDHALRQASLRDERLAEQHLGVQDDPGTPHVDEKVEAVRDFVHKTQRALEMQDQARPSTNLTMTRDARAASTQSRSVRH